MAGKYGVKETCDLLNAIQAMGVAILKEIKKDGFQATDLMAFIKSQEFEAALGDAIEGVQMVPAELTESDWLDGLALGRHCYAMATAMLDALRGEAA